jgi:TRAP-type C4-dicarboxylate transport system permease small subunit
MKTASGIICIIATALIIYGYWGAFTSSGNKVYDEMDAYFPFFLLIGGVVLFIIFLILLIIISRKAKNN